MKAIFDNIIFEGTELEIINAIKLYKDMLHSTDNKESVVPYGSIIKKKDVVIGKIAKSKGWRRQSTLKNNSKNTYTFYTNLEDAEQQAESLGIDKTNIYTIRPTASAENYKKYPVYYFIEQNRTIDTIKNARRQYNDTWYRMNGYTLPSDIFLHISIKHVYTKAYRYIRKSIR